MTHSSLSVAASRRRTKASQRPSGDQRGRASPWAPLEPGVVEESDRLRIAAVLAADAELDLGIPLAAPLGTDVHELANPVGVESFEGIALQQSLLEVGGHHAAFHVVPAESERHLGEVV